MNEIRTIEVDARTAEALERQAAEQGVSVADLLSEIAKSARRTDLAADAADADQIAELDRRWASHKANGGVAHERVVRWLETWGTPSFRPWPKQ